MLGVFYFLVATPQRSPVRLLEARWHNHTPDPLKCEVGQKRGVYERDRVFHRTFCIRERGFRANERAIFTRGRACIEAKSIKRQNEEKKVDKTIDRMSVMIYNIIIKLKKWSIPYDKNHYSTVQEPYF